VAFKWKQESSRAQNSAGHLRFLQNSHCPNSDGIGVTLTTHPSMAFERTSHRSPRLARQWHRHMERGSWQTFALKRHEMLVHFLAREAAKLIDRTFHAIPVAGQLNLPQTKRLRGVSQTQASLTGKCGSTCLLAGLCGKHNKSGRIGYNRLKIRIS